MKNSFLSALFNKHILVSDKGENQVEVLYALLNKMNVKVTAGFELANADLIRFASDQLGEYIPAPFYAGFPQSVRELTPEALLLDQLVHYTKTYGFGDFEEAGHSVFEDAVARSEFSEEDEPKEFVIMSENEAKVELFDLGESLCENTRPLNIDQIYLLADIISEYDWMPKNIASKMTAVELLYRLKDVRFAKFIKLQDVIKLVDFIQWDKYNSEKLNKLHLKNQDRKFITKVIDILANDFSSWENHSDIFEKRDVWKGLLHHIHYAAKTENAKRFIAGIYARWPSSYYSSFERAMKSKLYRPAVAQYLKANKGNGTLLRNLNYILSSTPDKDIDVVLDIVDAKNPIVIMQMQNMYRNYNEGDRVFKFTRHGRVRTHRETGRKNFLPKETRNKVVESLEAKLQAALAGKAGKVYIAPGMERIAVPMNMSASESGFGILPTGSRVSLPEGKKVRAFTYWEKVNDIDLACFGIGADGERTEFSWRTMYSRQSDAVTYSGDETSGYAGGSEYFDIDLDKVRELYPNMKYLIFTDNVYSGKDFSEVVCRAGWMSRDILDSGEVYEPKTVRSAYTINAKSTFCYLYAIDIEKREVIWLNLADAQRRCVAGSAEFEWLNDYFTACETMNMRKLFTYAAKEVVDNPDEADLVVGDIETDKPQIRSYEFEKAFAYLS